MAHMTKYRRGIAAALATTMLALPMAIQPALFSTGSALAHEQVHELAEIVKTVKPGVVTVLTVGNSGAESLQQLPQIPDGPFKDFMERFFQDPPGVPQKRSPGHKTRGLGSGFVIDEAGYIVTNRHVIADADQITVVLDDGTQFPATLVGKDDKTDLAVLQVTTDTELTAVEWGDSNTMEVGDPIFAIGNPFGLGGTVTSGIVSARGRDLRSGPYDDFLQVDAAINRGNSGGPLFSHDGKVIGVNTAIYSPNGGNVGLGFAIPSNQARKIIAELIDNGSVERGFIGVSIQPVTPEIADSLGLNSAKGALVASITENGPAATAGLKTGDVILSFGPTQIESARDIARIVADTDPGSRQRMAVWRDGRAQSLTITVGRMEDQPRTAAIDDATKASPVGSLGLALAELDDEVRARLGLDSDTSGVAVVGVDPEKPAASRGISVGDVILAVGQTRISNLAELRDALESLRDQQRKSALLLIQHRGRQTYVAVPLAVA